MYQKENNHLIFEISAFINSRLSKKLSLKTIAWYKEQFTRFLKYCERVEFDGRVEDITPVFIRDHLIDIGSRASAGTMHAAYRALKAFFNWYEIEVEPENWKNPIRKVEAPKYVINPLPGVTHYEFEALINACGKDFYGKRNKAILRALIDTGVRRGEFVKMNVGDLDIDTGSINVLWTKNHKRRSVFLAPEARKEVIRYLRILPDRKRTSPLWVTKEGTRLTYNGLREIIRRLSAKAGIQEPSPHDFRRAFALQCRRNGMGEIDLMRIMGESSTQVLSRYVDFDDEDLRKAHENSRPDW